MSLGINSCTVHGLSGRMHLHSPQFAVCAAFSAGQSVTIHVLQGMVGSLGPCPASMPPTCSWLACCNTRHVLSHADTWRGWMV